MSVAGALAFVLVRTARNRIVAALKWLARPRYLTAALLAVAFFYGLKELQTADGPISPVVNELFAPPPPEEVAPDEPAVDPPEVEPDPAWNAEAIFVSVFTLFTLIWLLRAWVMDERKLSLNFSEAEIHFFFTAPTTRRALLHYRALKLFLGSGVFALITNLVVCQLGRGIWPTLGLWVAIWTYRLHVMGAARTRQALLDRGFRAWSGLPLYCGALALGVAAALAANAVGLPPLEQRKAFASALTKLVLVPPLEWLVFPIRFYGMLLLSTGLDWFLFFLSLVAPVTALHYVWAVGSDTAFEESTVHAADARARPSDKAREAKDPAPSVKVRAVPFRLGHAGRPEVALVWLGAVANWRSFNGRVVVSLALILGAMMALVAAVGDPAKAGSAVALVLLAIWLVLVVLIGAMGDGDRRREVERMQLMRSWPLTGRQLVMGGALGSLLPIIIIQWLVLALGVGLMHPRMWPQQWTAADLTATALAAALAGPVLTLMGLMVNDALVVFWPGWAGKSDVESILTRPLALVLNLLVSGVGMMPATFVGALVGFAVLPWLGVWALPVGTAVMTAIGFYETWLFAAVIGRAVEKSTHSN